MLHISEDKPCFHLCTSEFKHFASFHFASITSAFRHMKGEPNASLGLYTLLDIYANDIILYVIHKCRLPQHLYATNVIFLFHSGLFPEDLFIYILQNLIYGICLIFWLFLIDGVIKRDIQNPFCRNIWLFIKTAVLSSRVPM